MFQHDRSKSTQSNYWRRCIFRYFLHQNKTKFDLDRSLQLAWAPGKGMKDKQWKEYWEVDLGVSYIPIDKLDPQVDMAALEEVTNNWSHIVKSGHNWSQMVTNGHKWSQTK